MTVVPLAQAFAHRDSAHPRPVSDALDAGFTALEVDVWLRGGQLLVGHDETELRPDRTLADTYLRPLAARAAAGRIRAARAAPATADTGEAGGWPVTLVVDVKTAAAPTYRALDGLLREHTPLLTRWRYGRCTPGPLTVLVSGERAVRALTAAPDRLAALDGRPGDLLPGAGHRGGAALRPVVSADWEKTVGWDGTGPLPRARRILLAAMVRRAHARQRRLRFWATPDTPGPARSVVWDLLLNSGVDLINTDDLTGLAGHLRARAARALL